MPTPRFIKVTDVNVGNAGGKATVEFKTGKDYAYQAINLIIGDSGAANANAPVLDNNGDIVTDISLKFGSNVQRIASAYEINEINKAQGASLAAQGYVGGGNGLGRLHIPLLFAEPYRDRVLGNSVSKEALAWPTEFLRKRNDTFQLELQWAAGITPFLEVEAIVHTSQFEGIPSIIKWSRDDRNKSAAAITSHSLPYDEPIVQISAFDTAAETVDQLNLKVGAVDVIENIGKNSMTSWMKWAEMNPAAGAYHAVFDRMDSLTEVLPPANNRHELKRTFSGGAAASVRAIVQTWGKPYGYENAS